MIPEPVGTVGLFLVKYNNVMYTEKIIRYHHPTIYIIDLFSLHPSEKLEEEKKRRLVHPFDKFSSLNLTLNDMAF